MLDVGLFVLAPKGKDLSILTNEDQIPKFPLQGLGLLKDQLTETANQYFQTGDGWVEFRSLGYVEPPLTLYFGLILPEEVPLKAGVWQSLAAYMDKMSPEMFARLSGFVLENM